MTRTDFFRQWAIGTSLLLTMGAETLAVKPERPIIYADRKHDDLPGLLAWLDGRTAYKPSGEEIPAYLVDVHFRLSYFSKQTAKRVENHPRMLRCILFYDAKE